LSAWNDFTNYLKSLAGAPVGAAGSFAAGQVQQTAQRAGLNQQASIQGAQSALAPLTTGTVKAQERLSSVVMPVVTTLDEKVYQPFYEGLGAAALAVNPDTYNGVSVKAGLERAWSGSKEIPFGNAVADIWANTYNALPDVGLLAELNKVDIDIYDQQARDRVYSRFYDESGQRVDRNGTPVESASWVENVWRGQSMILDTTKQLVADPFLILGKAAKSARLAKLDVFRTPGTEFIESVAKESNAAAASRNTAAKYQRKLIDQDIEAKRANTLLESYNNGEVSIVDLADEMNQIRIENGVKPLPQGQNPEVYVNDLTKYADRKRKDMATTQTRIDEALNRPGAVPTAANGVSDFVRQVVDSKMNWREIAAHKTVQEFSPDPEFLGVVLEQAASRGDNAVYEVLNLASGGDPGALLRLRSQHDDLVKLIDGAQRQVDAFEVEIQRVLETPNTDLANRLNEHKQFYSDYIDTLVKDDQYLQMITESDRQIQLIGTPFANYKKYNFVEKFRADRAKIKAGIADGTIGPKSIISEGGEFEWHRVQKSPLHKAVYVAQWTGHKLNRENPAGLVTVGGLDQFDAIKELDSFFDVGALGQGKFWDAEPDLKNQLKTEFMMALDSTERKDVLTKIENESFRIMAEKFGAKDIMVDVEHADGVVISTPVWELMRDAFFEKRAKDIAQFRKDKGFLVDTNQTLIGNPVMASQFDYAVPMIDLKELYSYYALHVSRDAELGTLIADPSKLQALYAGTKVLKDGIALPAWSVVDRLWRADVLLRLGYPQRNVLSEYMVLSQYGAGLPGLFRGEISASGKRFIQNRHAHMQDIQKRAQATVEMADATGRTGVKVGARILSKSGLFRVSWAKYEQFAVDNLELLREQRQSIVDEYDYLTSTGEEYGIVYPENTLSRLDTQIALEESRLKIISERVAAKGERFGTKNMRGKDDITIDAHEFAGVYAGEQGMAVQKLISSSGRQGFDRSPHSSALKEMKLEGTGDYIKMQPTEKGYTPQLAGIINQQFRGAETVRMVINGDSDQAILAYLNTPAGKRELEKLHWKQDVLKANKKGGTRKAGQEDPPLWDPNRLRRTGVLLDETPAENYLEFVRSQIVENYLPNDEIRQLVKEKFANGENVTTADINLYIPKEQRVPIHGEKMEEGGLWKALINPKFNNTEKIEMLLFDRFIKKMFTWLGQYPEDAFVSNPFADSVYKAKLKEITIQWDANGIKPTKEDVFSAQEAARIWAISESRRYLYRVVRENRIGSYIPLLSPFFQAQYSTTRRFGKLLYRNPDKSARLIWAWNQINTNSVEDEKGNRTLVFRIPSGLYAEDSKLPDVLKNALRSKDTLSWNVNSFNLLFAGLRITPPDVLPGDTETTSEKVGRWAQTGQSILGTGPFVQIAATEWLKSDPSINTDNAFTEFTGVALPAREFIEVFASPYPSENWYDPLTSAWNKRAMSIIQKDGNKDWESTKVVMFQNHIHAQQTGEEPLLSNDPSENIALVMELAGKEATAFLAVRLVANLTAAFVPSYQGPMTPYVEEYRKLMTKDPATAYDEFLRQYPDMGYIAISLSKNLTGSAQSVDAVSIEQRYSNTLENAVTAASGVGDKSGQKYVQMVTNGDVGSSVLRDAYSGYWQRNQGNRITVSAEEGLQSQQLRDGWGKYVDMMDSFNAELERRGISRYSAAADQMNEIRRKWIAEQATKNNVWYTEFKAGMDSDSSLYAVNFMKTMLNDPAFVESQPKDSWWFAAEKYIEMRDSLAQYIVDNKQGAATKEQLAMVEAYVKPLLKDPTFAYYYNRYLDNDKFSLSKVGY
jgi:hypothetical protein